MRALLVLCVLAAPAVAEPEIHLLTQSNGQWVVSPAELAKDLNARIAADTNKPSRTWKCHTGLMSDVLVSWHCEGEGAGVHHMFLIRGGKLVPFDLTAEIKSKDALTGAVKRWYRTGRCEGTLDVTADSHGLAFYTSAGGVPTCPIAWQEAYSALRTDGLLAQIVRMTPRTFWE
jgi:hypothetical protein